MQINKGQTTEFSLTASTAICPKWSGLSLIGQLPIFALSFQTPEPTRKKMNMLINSILSEAHFSSACLVFPMRLPSPDPAHWKPPLLFMVKHCYSLADL